MAALQLDIKGLLKKNTISFVGDYFWHYTLISIFVKSVFFIGIIYSESREKIDLIRAVRLIWSFPIYLSFITAILSFAFLFRSRLKMIFSMAVNILVTFIILVDIWNYRAFEAFISIHSKDNLVNIGNLGDSILSMVRFADAIFVADILLIPLFAKIIRKKINLADNSRRSILAFVLLFVLSTAFISYSHYNVDIKRKYKGKFLFTVCWTPRTTMLNLSPIGYHIFDIYVYWRDCQPVKLSTAEVESIEKWFRDKQEVLPDNKYKGIFEGKNLIFIETESLENCVVNQKINGQEITPALNKLLGNSIYFPNFYEQTLGGTSSDAMLLGNTSVYPIRRGTTFFRYPNNTYNSLPSLLEARGYSTLAIEPDRGSYWNWMNALTSFGFDQCMDSSYFYLDEKIGLGLSDGSFLRQIGPVVLKQKQPFYLFLVTQTTHTPYDLPGKYRELTIDEKINNTKLGGYLQSLHYTDKHIGVFLANLDKNGILDDTVVVIYGDHGGVHKFYPNEIPDAQLQEKWWLENNYKVPFVIYSKGMKGEIVKTIGSQIDILPTVAYLMGVDEKEYIYTALGRNLLKTNKSFAVLSNKNYIGKAGSESEKNEAVRGVDISDIIIKSNYFKVYRK
ncbi:MAG: LTA synthase family protein [Clostridia bacterium]|nr:LTA synthase family protein [Clostridia bacterium]